MKNLLLISCSGFLLISSLMVILSQSHIYAVLSLVTGFLSTSLMFLLFECEFIALIFTVVYVGAIAVLFIFAVMVFDVKLKTFPRDPFKYYPLGGFVIFVLLYELVLSGPYNLRFSKASFDLNHLSCDSWYTFIDISTDLKTLGQLIYTHYILQFLLAGLVLFLVLVGVTVLTLPFNQKNGDYQNSVKQLSRVNK